MIRERWRGQLISEIKASGYVARFTVLVKHPRRESLRAEAGLSHKLCTIVYAPQHSRYHNWSPEHRRGAEERCNPGRGSSRSDAMPIAIL